MLKALMRKQFAELFSFLSRNRRTGKPVSVKGMIGFCLLFGFVVFSLGMAFFEFASAFALALVPVGLDWMFFTIMGLIAVVAGVIGDVFSTYSTLYFAKDNDFLLSMPIRPGAILFVRLFSVYAIGILYEAIAFVPTMIAYWFVTDVTPAKVIFPILVMFLLGLFVVTLTCLLGWLVALISSRVRNKTVVTVVLSLVFIVGYYYVYFRVSRYLSVMLEKVISMTDVVRSWLYPFYLLGQGCSGHGWELILFALMIAVLFAATYLIMSLTFIRIVTTNRGISNRAYKEKKQVVHGVKRALFLKELRHFTGSATYLLNTGLGILFLLLAAVIIPFRAADFSGLLGAFAVEYEGFARCLPAFAVCAVGAVVSINAISAPSVSLEGNTVWILQSFPVSGADILFSKAMLASALNLLPAVAALIVLCIVIGTDLPGAAAAVVTVCIMIRAQALFGVVIGVTKPNLEWTSETTPVKQSVPVIVTMLAALCVCMAIAVPYWFLNPYLPCAVYLALWAVILAALCAVMHRWIQGEGERKFAALSV